MAQEWQRAQFTIDNILHTEVNILNGIQDFLEQVGWELASWSAGTYGSNDRHFIRTDRNVQPRWQFTGDGATQHGGIRVRYDATPNTTTGTSLFTGEVHIVIQSFLENAAGTNRQVTTPDYVPASGSSVNPERFGSIRIKYDNTAPNQYLLVGGEDGLYVEAGRDNLATNLGHGAVMTFQAIPENNSPFDSTAQWTAQGLVCDLFGPCRITHNRNLRFVANDGSNKNFTAGLQPYAPRGTSTLGSPTMFDQRPYYIGSRDTLYGMGRGVITPTNPAVASSGSIDLAYHATFGLFNTPESGRFRISTLLMMQAPDVIAMAVSSGSTSNVVAATASTSGIVDPRVFRQIPKFAAIDHTLLPFVTVQDAASGATYRVGRVEDNGRFSQLGILWPSQNFLTISLS